MMQTAQNRMCEHTMAVANPMAARERAPYANMGLLQNMTRPFAIVSLCGCVALAACNRAPADDTAAVRSTPASCETLAAIALPAYEGHEGGAR